jgi:hypothetical protein
MDPTPDNWSQITLDLLEALRKGARRAGYSLMLGEILHPRPTPFDLLPSCFAIHFAPRRPALCTPSGTFSILGTHAVGNERKWLNEMGNVLGAPGDLLKQFHDTGGVLQFQVAPLPSTS